MNYKEKLAKARAIVVMDEPFFASILLKRKMIELPSGTFAVDARAQIYFNPEFVETLTVGQVVFALVHECLHIVKLDFARVGTRVPRKWNKAGDAWINNYLKGHNVGEPIDKCINCNGGEHIDVDIKADTTEEIYARIPEGDKGGSDGSGEPGGSGDYGIGDDLTGEPLSESEASEVEAKVKVEIASSAQAAKMMGKLPADMERVLEEVLFVRTPWETILERFMTEIAKSETSWNKPHKKYRPLGYYLPSSSNIPTMGEMALIVDVSGSVGPKELAFFGGHFNRVIEMCKPESVKVLYVDTRVAHVDEYTQDDDFPITLTLHGGGGTDMREGFKWIKENMESPECIVLLTDGYTPWPEDKDVSAPTIVLCTTDIACPPFMEVVRFDCNE